MESASLGTHGWGACPRTEDAEEVKDLLTDILSKSAVDPGSDPGGGGGKGSGWSPCHQHWGCGRVPLDSLEVGLWV